MQHLEFTIDGDGEHNYLVYLSNKLDIEINDNIYNSFGVTTNRILAERGSNLTKSAKRMLISEYICSKINDVLDLYWDVNAYGMPVIKLIGDVDTLDSKFTTKNIIIYTFNTNPEKWINELTTTYAWPNDGNFIFLARHMRYSDTYDIISDSIDFVTVWLTKEGNKSTQAIDTPEIKLSKLMHNWYAPDEYNTLSNLADQTIMNFVVMGKINIYIPSYLVVLSHHIKRYKKALDTIESLYHPKFIMTLPIYRGNCNYTVLFPILEDITTNTVRR